MTLSEQSKSLLKLALCQLAVDQITMPKWVVSELILDDHLKQTNKENASPPHPYTHIPTPTPPHPHLHLLTHTYTPPTNTIEIDLVHKIVTFTKFVTKEINSPSG